MLLFEDLQSWGDGYVQATLWIMRSRFSAQEKVAAMELMSNDMAALMQLTGSSAAQVHR